MHLMHKMYGYNTRCCGIEETALIPLNQQLTIWADEIICMEDYMVPVVREVADMHLPNVKIRSLQIPDEYDYMDEELQQLIQRRFFSS